MRRFTSGLRWVSVIGATGMVFMLLVGAATGSTPAQSFTVAIAPNGLTAGTPAVAIGSFTNSGPTIAHVAITLTFPFPVNVLGHGCATLHVLTKTVACVIGPVAQGATVSAAVPFTAPATTGSFSLQGLAGFITGPPHPTAGLLQASTTSTVFANNDPAHKGTCTAAPSSFTSATADNQQVSLTTVPSPTDPSLLLLGCTPVGVGVTATAGFPTDVFSVDLPQLSTPAQVSLDFPDELLPKVPTNVPGNGPGVQRDKHQPPGLLELTAAYPAGTPVPVCTSGFTTIPSPADACIASIQINDPDHDGDAGTINLLVQGTGVDPRFAG